MQRRIPPPLIVLIAGALMWALDRWIPLGQWIHPPWNRIGALPALIGVAFSIAAIARFRRAATTVSPMDPGKASSLVTDGVYRMSRNPMYLGLLLVLIGWGLWLGTASPWVIPPLFGAVVTRMQINPEERALARLFGAQYTEYQGRVARWIGRAREGNKP